MIPGMSSRNLRSIDALTVERDRFKVVIFDSKFPENDYDIIECNVRKYAKVRFVLEEVCEETNSQPRRR